MYQEQIYDLEEKIFELESKIEAKDQEIKNLANIATVITSILDTESVLSLTMEIGIQQVNGEVGALILMEDGRMAVRAAWGVDASFIEKLEYRDGLDIARYCIKNKRTAIENDCPRIFGTSSPVQSLIAVPLPAASVEGLIIIFNKADGNGFTVTDRESLEMICRFTSISIDNTSLLITSLEKQKLEQELNVAHEVQTTLLPDISEIDGLRIASTYIPARQVGGDYYDLIPIGHDKLLFLLGDVTNKGVPAALVMTSVYAIIHAYVNAGQPIQVTDLITQLNDILCNDIIKGRGMFITIFIAYIDLEQGTMEYCNGGHPPPFYYRKGTGRTERLKPGGPLVGQFAGLPYRSTKIHIHPGDRIFTYSDGLIEAENKQGELYGLDRLEEFFKAGLVLDTERFNTVLKEEIDRYSVDSREESIDDFTTLVVDIKDVEAKEHMYEFTYASTLDSLAVVYSDLDTFFDRHKVSAKLQNSLRVTISEAITNAIIHANNYAKDKVVKLRLHINKSQLTADILDQGNCIGINTIKQPDLGGDFMAEGGRGLGLIKQLSDDLKITLRPSGGLRIRIINYLSNTLHTT